MANDDETPNIDFTSGITFAGQADTAAAMQAVINELVRCALDEINSETPTADGFMERARAVPGDVLTSRVDKEQVDGVVDAFNTIHKVAPVAYVEVPESLTHIETLAGEYGSAVLRGEWLAAAATLARLVSVARGARQRFLIDEAADEVANTLFRDGGGTGLVMN